MRILLTGKTSGRERVMEISLIALQIAIIFLPGLVWARLDATYGLKTKPTDTEFFMRAFMFGLASYAVTFIVFSLLRRPFSLVDLGRKDTALVTPAIAYEIISATAISFVLAVIWLYATNYKLITHFLQWIGATKTYGDEDVWDFTFNSQNRQWNMYTCGILRTELYTRDG